MASGGSAERASVCSKQARHWAVSSDAAFFGRVFHARYVMDVTSRWPGERGDHKLAAPEREPMCREAGTRAETRG